MRCDNLLKIPLLFQREHFSLVWYAPSTISVHKFQYLLAENFFFSRLERNLSVVKKAGEKVLTHLNFSNSQINKQWETNLSGPLNKKKLKNFNTQKQKSVKNFYIFTMEQKSLQKLLYSSKTEILAYFIKNLFLCILSKQKFCPTL